MEDPVSVDEDFSEFVALLDFPMFIITTAADGERSGCLVGFTSQVSIDPQLFLVCLSKPNHTAGVVRAADHLAVHRLRADQVDLASLFGEETGDEIDKFVECQWSAGPHGVPVLDDVAAWFVGEIVERIDMGDHVGHLVRPVEVGINSHSPETVTFARARSFEPGHEA